MKIAFVSQPWNNLRPPVQSGSLAILTYQAAYRLANKVDVMVYAKGKELRSPPTYDQGVEYRWINIALDRRWHKLLKYFSKGRTEDSLVSSNLYHIGYILQIALDLRKRNCDVVHLFNFAQFAPVIKRFNPNIKVVLQMGCDWLTQFDPAVVDANLASVDLILGCSDYIPNRVKTAFPYVSGRTQTVYNAVDIGHFAQKLNLPDDIDDQEDNQSEDDQAKKVTFVGRVSPEKGIHTLLAAFQKVMVRYPTAQLEIIGPTIQAPFGFIVGVIQDPKVIDLVRFYSSDYYTDMKKQAAEKLADNVFFRGAIPHSKLIEKYQNSDVFVFPSVWEEPFGIPLIEAMATGTPVVATNGGAFPEIVAKDKTGLLVERGNADELADALIQLLADASLRRRMGEAVRVRAVAYFSYDTMTEQFFEAYQRLCKPAAGSGLQLQPSQSSDADASERIVR